MNNVRSPRKRPQQRRSQATVDTLLDAATEVFCAGGFQSATTNAVAARAGVSIGSFYQYFSNKQALLESLRERHVKGLWAEIGAACEEACSRPWPAALRHVIQRCGAYNGRHADLMAMIHRELPVHSQSMERLVIARSTLDQQLRKFLETHRDSIKVSVDQALFMLPALGRGIFTAGAVQQPQAVRNEQLVDEVVSAMLGYLT